MNRPSVSELWRLTTSQEILLHLCSSNFVMDSLNTPTTDTVV